MKKNKFQFTSISIIEDATFDQSLEKFYNYGIEGTIKENIQNSLDARLYNNFEHPVNIKITLEKIHKSILPGIEEVFEHIHSLKGGNGYTQETVDYMKAQYNLNKVPVLTIEDSNTKGLTGAKKGQEFSKRDTFGIYAYKKGVHSIEEDSNKEQSRGGSHGIGKIANNAISDINLMYFANCDHNHNQHIGGTVHLIEHKLGNSYYRATGYYSDLNENNILTPFENYENYDILKKDTRGLKIIIPYIRKEFFDSKKIVTSICDNFFLAIINNYVNIKIIDGKNIVEINSGTIKQIIQDNEYYETRIEEMKKVFTPLYVTTYLNSEKKEIIISNSEESFKFKLYFYYDENIFSGRVALFRTIGMKILDLKVKNRVRKPFNAVLIGGIREDNYLKSLENESHTDISGSIIRDRKEKNNAKKFIKNLHIELTKVIDEFINGNNTIDEQVNTGDLFLETMVSFKKDIETNTQKVELSNSNGIRKVKDKKEWRDKRTLNNSNIKDGISNKKRRPRKIKDAVNSEVEAYITPLDVVKRIQLSEREYLNINMNEAGLDLSINKCNLKINVLDGMGKIVNEYFRIQDYYDKVLDTNTGKIYYTKENIIYGVEIEEGNINLELIVNKYNVNNLKFLYILEVEE